MGRLGLPDWFGRAYFSYHSQVRRRFKLAAGLGELCCRDGGILQGCLSSMIFIVAVCVPWCRHLEATPDVEPQLYADNRKCSVERPGALFDSARFTAKYARAVGQDVSLGKCVLLGTSKSVRKTMKLWDISGEGRFWKVQLDVRDLERHLISLIAPGRVPCLAGLRVLLLVLLRWVVKLGLVRGKYILASLHAAEASCVSASSLGAFRAAVVEAVWSSQMPLANTPAVLSLLDGPVGVDPALRSSFAWCVAIWHIALRRSLGSSGCWI